MIIYDYMRYTKLQYIMKYVVSVATGFELLPPSASRTSQATFGRSQKGGIES